MGILSIVKQMYDTKMICLNQSSNFWILKWAKSDGGVAHEKGTINGIITTSYIIRMKYLLLHINHTHCLLYQQHPALWSQFYNLYFKVLWVNDDKSVVFAYQITADRFTKYIRYRPQV